jgi:hypothetical protein
MGQFEMHRLAVVLLVEYSKSYDPRIARSIGVSVTVGGPENTVVHASVVGCRLALYYFGEEIHVPEKRQ